MVNIFIVLLQRTSVEQIYGKAILVNSNYFLKGTNPLWIWVTINKITLAIFFMILVSPFSTVQTP